MDNKYFLLFFCLISYTIQSQCWKSVATAENHTIAITEDGKLWGWGQNTYYNLGDGTNINRINPIQIGTDTNWKSVSSNNAHTVAIKIDGTLWAWGYNWDRQLGDGTNITRGTPTQIGTDTNWKQVVAGGVYTAALKTDGTLWTWGRNIYGLLGVGSQASLISTPTQVGNYTEWQNITGGASHVLALRNDGTLWGWGSNQYGELLGGIDAYKFVPTQIGTANNWQKISTGNNYSLAIKTDGTLWAWGRNSWSNLGDGANTQRSSLVQIGIDNDWVSICGGIKTTLALKSNGSLWGWGSNSAGQLNNPNTSTIITTPTLLDTALDWRSLTASAYHDTSQVIKNDGSLWSCGYNLYGQVGDGMTSNRNNFFNLVCPTTLDVAENPTALTTLTISPNPCHSYITISQGNDKATLIKYQLTDTLGRMIKQGSAHIGEPIYVEDIESSYYIISVTHPNKKVTKLKFIKE